MIAAGVYIETIIHINNNNRPINGLERLSLEGKTA